MEPGGPEPGGPNSRELSGTRAVRLPLKCHHRCWPRSGTPALGVCACATLTVLERPSLGIVWVAVAIESPRIWGRGSGLGLGLAPGCNPFMSFFP